MQLCGLIRILSLIIGQANMKQNSFNRLPLSPDDLSFFSLQELTFVQKFHKFMIIFPIRLLFVYSSVVAVATLAVYSKQTRNQKPVTSLTAQNISGYRTLWARIVTLSGYSQLNDCMLNSRSIHIHNSCIWSILCYTSQSLCNFGNMHQLSFTMLSFMDVHTQHFLFSSDIIRLSLVILHQSTGICHERRLNSPSDVLHSYSRLSLAGKQQHWTFVPTQTTCVYLSPASNVNLLLSCG